MERCHPLQAPLSRPSQLGVLKSSLQGVPLLFLRCSVQGSFLWAKLIHVWKLTVDSQTSDGQNQGISPGLGLYLVGSVAIRESSHPPQVQSRFTELQQATS